MDNPIDDLDQLRRTATPPGPFETGDVLSQRIRSIKQVAGFVEANESVLDPAPRFPPPAHHRFTD